MWRQKSEIHSFQIFPDRTAHAGSVEEGNICSVSVFFVRVGSQIPPRFKYPLPWENKIIQMPYPTTQSNPHPMPCRPPPPPRQHNIDRYIISGRSGHTHRTNFPGVRGSFTTVKVSRAIDTSIMIIGKEISQSVKCIQKTQTFRGYDEKPWQL